MLFKKNLINVSKTKSYLPLKFKTIKKRNGLKNNFIHKVFAIGSTIYALADKCFSISFDNGHHWKNYTKKIGLKSLFYDFIVDGYYNLYYKLFWPINFKR